MIRSKDSTSGPAGWVGAILSRVPGWVVTVAAAAAVWGTVGLARSSTDLSEAESQLARPLALGVSPFMQPAWADENLYVLLPDGSHARWGDLRERLAEPGDPRS